MSLSEMRLRLNAHLETLIESGTVGSEWSSILGEDTTQRHEQLARDQLKRIIKALEGSTTPPHTTRRPILVGQAPSPLAVSEASTSAGRCTGVRSRPWQAVIWPGLRLQCTWHSLPGNITQCYGWGIQRRRAGSLSILKIDVVSQRAAIRSRTPPGRAPPPPNDGSVGRRRKDGLVNAVPAQDIVSFGDDRTETIQFQRPTSLSLVADDENNCGDADVEDDDRDGESVLLRCRAERLRRPSRPKPNPDKKVEKEAPEPSIPVTLYYKMPGENRILRQILHQSGFRRQRSGSNWDLHWISGRSPVRLETFRHLRPGQKMNRFPLLDQITRKDSLFINVARMQDHHAAGNPYCFIPETFLLPTDADKLDRTYHSLNHRTSAWIVKPHASCQGRGIFVTRKLTDIPHNSHLVVSRYIAHPYLIQGPTDSIYGTLIMSF